MLLVQAGRVAQGVVAADCYQAFDLEMLQDA
jgi:hypothetical protein